MSQLPEERLAALRRAGTFLLVVLGWVLFRAASLSDALDMYASMLWPRFGELPTKVEDALVAPAVIALCVGMASALLPRRLVMGRLLDGGWRGWPLRARVAVMAAVPFAAITVAAGSFSPFLYFQF
ncbi:MAG TPA: hypothetical protein VGV10_04710 [Thermoleophilaceae bacterium]|nr:hypothetical protein [Thermoleophilaceae bacterium]